MEFKAAQLITVTHQKKEFFFFHVLEKQNVSLMLLLFIVPLLLEPNFLSNLINNFSVDEDVILGFKYLSYISLLFGCLRNLIILFVFNPRGSYVAVQACAACVGASAAIVGTVTYHET